MQVRIAIFQTVLKHLSRLLEVCFLNGGHCAFLPHIKQITKRLHKNLQPCCRQIRI